MLTVTDNGMTMLMPIRVNKELEIAICYTHSGDNKFRSADVYFKRTDGIDRFPTTLIVTLCQQTVIKYLKLQECNLKDFKQPFDFLAHALACNFVSEHEIELASEQLSFDLFAEYSANLVGAQSSVKTDTAHSQKTISELKARLIKKGENKA